MMMLTRCKDLVLSTSFHVWNNFFLFNSLQVALAQSVWISSLYQAPFTINPFLSKVFALFFLILHKFYGFLKVLLTRLHFNSSTARCGHHLLVSLISNHVIVGRAVKGILI